MIATVLIDQGPGLPKLAMLDPAVSVRGGQAELLLSLVRKAKDLDSLRFPARHQGETEAKRIARYDAECFKCQQDLRTTAQYIIGGWC